MTQGDKDTVGAPSAAPRKAAQPAASPTSTARIGPLTIALWIVFGLFFAYLLWQGISALAFPNTTLALVKAVSLPLFLAVTGSSLLVPVITAAAAVLLGRHRRVPQRAALLLVALASSGLIMSSIWSLGTLALAS
ncbi:MAG TPA: hypothetical protein GX406_02950 [Pseudoclavibacter sp.]|nr:hypothetical protein [Pseudoclavibacter sp.]